MASRVRSVSVRRRLVGECERLELRDDETGRIVTLRPDLADGGNVPCGTRHEAILTIAKAARWRVDHVRLAWSERDLVARISLMSDEAQIKLDARVASALRLALAASCSVAIEDTAWDELVRRADPIPSARVADFAAELDRRGAEEILRELGQAPPRPDVA
jgi:hypothetical protein